MAQAELSETVHALLRAAAELSREQSLLDQDPERTTVPRDYAVTKVITAFRAFEAGAKAPGNRSPSPSASRPAPTHEPTRKHSVDQGYRSHSHMQSGVCFRERAPSLGA